MGCFFSISFSPDSRSQVLSLDWLRGGNSLILLANINVNHFFQRQHPEANVLAFAKLTQNRGLYVASEDQLSINDPFLLFFLSSFVAESSGGGCVSSFWVSVGDSALSDIL